MSLRVVFFMPNLAVGGLQRHAIDLAEELRCRGYFAKIIICRDYVSSNLQSQMAPDDYILLDEQRKMLDPRSWPRQWRAINTLRPDIVIGVSQTPIIVLAILKALGKLKAKLGCTFGTTIPRPRDWMRRPLFKWALRRTDALIYCSTLQAAFWRRKGLRSLRDMVIYNGIRTDAFAPAGALRDEARKALAFAADDVVFGLVGAFRPEKNHGQLVDAVWRLRADGFPAKAVFIGDGATRPQVQARVTELGLGDHILFAGEHADVRPWIRALDAGVLCSVAVETFSIAALELMASGMPMIHSRLGGAAEMIDDGVDGFIFDIGNTDQLVAAMKALADPAVRATMSAAARDKVLTKFTMDAMVAQYIDLFEDMCRGR